MARAPVAAAILAGGKARRLGGAIKSTLPIGGVRIIDRQLAALSQVADPIFVVANDPAPFASLGLTIVSDVMPGYGALGGIYSAIVRSPRERTLIVAGDLPGLSVPLLERLVRPSEAEIVVPCGPRGYEPLCAVYARLVCRADPPAAGGRRAQGERDAAGGTGRSDWAGGSRGIRS